jgi:hypothetical protein
MSAQDRAELFTRVAGGLEELEGFVELEVQEIAAACLGQIWVRHQAVLPCWTRRRLRPQQTWGYGERCPDLRT